jgi:hypothetical protein
MPGEELDGMSVEWYNVRLGAPIVSFGLNGLTFTPAARALLGDPAYIKVGVDPEIKAVLVCKADIGDECALEFKNRIDKNGYARLSQRDIPRFALSKMAGLDLRVTLKCLARWDSSEKRLVIDLESSRLLAPPRKPRKRPNG